MELWKYVSWMAQVPEEPATSPGPGLMDLVPIFFIIFLLYYFIIALPQKKEQRKRASKVDELAKGDSVVTIGGIHGKIESVDKENGTVMVNVAPKVAMKFNQASLSQIESKKGKKGSDKGAGDRS